MFYFCPQKILKGVRLSWVWAASGKNAPFSSDWIIILVPSRVTPAWIRATLSSLSPVPRLCGCPAAYFQISLSNLSSIQFPALHSTQRIPTAFPRHSPSMSKCSLSPVCQSTSRPDSLSGEECRTTGLFHGKMTPFVPRWVHAYV